MKFYSLLLKNIPNVEFAHSYTTSNYCIDFDANPEMFEITYIEKGDTVRTFPSGLQGFFDSPCIMFSPRLEKFSQASYATLHQHYTIGIYAEYELHEITYPQINQFYQQSFVDNNKNCCVAIIPEAIYDAKNIDIIGSLIKQIISEHSLNKPSKGLSSIGYLFTLFSKLTTWSIEQVLAHQKSDISFSDIAYVDKVIAYISKNVHSKIKVTDIASSLGLSVGHLSRMFKAVTGHSIIDYSNKMKINLVKELVETKNISSKEAREQIGISDEKYLYRLFKKHAGITMTEFRELSNIEIDPKTISE
ncbi:MAG: helix-turn-helix domain-containing protein [Clostridiales bacterium]|nr:helix-turn-helix domain-containing protein [Clostridiales bacterium]